MFAALAVAIILHEVAHGVSALWMGDDTAKRAGRLTLNPIPHIDPIGSIVLPLSLALMGSPVMFGWAKPVPVDLSRMRNPRKGLWLTAAAGPLTNLVLAAGAALLLRLIVWGSGVSLSELVLPSALGCLAYFLVYLVIIDLVLMVFNLVPIPPLDGSRVVAALLPPERAAAYLQLGRFGFLAIFLMMRFGVFEYVIEPVVTALATLLLG